MARQALALALAAATVLAASPVLAQPATSRTPNLEGTWTTPGGTGFFAFLHRFEVGGGGKVVNWPTFHLSAGMTDWLSVGTLYASQTEATPRGTNELEVFLAQKLLDEENGAPLSISLREALNVDIKSPDLELNLARSFGPLTLHSATRVLLRFRDEDYRRVSTGLGASLQLTPHLKLAGDASYPVVDPKPATISPNQLVWGAGLQMAIPYTPHTLSLQASNAASATMHGATTAGSAVRYGFDFTIPFSNGKQWLDIFMPAQAAPEPAPVPAASAAPEVAASAPPTPQPRSLKAAQAFFARSCAACHGPTGAGGFGPDLRRVDAKGDAFISTRILKGSPKGMPPFAGQLAGAELQDMIEFVKSL